MATGRVVLAVAWAGVACVSVASGQDVPPKASSSPPAGLPELLLQYGEASQPGVEHGQLDGLVGSWGMEVRVLGENGQSTTFSGRSENRWVLGDRFVLAEATAGPKESPVESITLYGFDRTEQRFFSVALSNLSTGFAPATGTYDAASKSFVLSGRQRDPLSGLAAFFRTLLRVEGNDRYVTEVFVDYGTRGPLKIMETVFTRSGATGDRERSH